MRLLACNSARSSSSIYYGINKKTESKLNLMNHVVRFKRNYDGSEFILCLNEAQYALIKDVTEPDLALSYAGFNSKELFFEKCTLVHRTALRLPKTDAVRLANVINATSPARLALIGIQEQVDHQC